jgi:hypothetical protein
MKKMLLLVSCVAVLLIFSNVSFAQEAAVVGSDAYPCVAEPAAFPFAFPPHRPFGSRLAALADRRVARAQVMMPYPGDPTVMPVAYPYGLADLKPRSVRRVAKLTAPPKPPRAVFRPYPMVIPAAAAGASEAGGAGLTYAPGPVGQTGFRNVLNQKSNSSSHVINFLSVVRAPRDYYPLPAQPQP